MMPFSSHFFKMAHNMQILDFNRENIKTDEITDPICGMEYNQTMMLIEKLIGLMLTIGWKIPKEYLC